MNETPSRGPRGTLLAAAALGASGVVMGAFGAHALRGRVAPELMEAYRTGALYHLLHAVAVLAVAAAGERLPGAWLAALLMTVGVVIFSGSLYLLAITGVHGWGAVTPFGGVALIAGWVSLFVCAVRKR